MAKRSRMKGAKGAAPERDGIDPEEFQRLIEEFKRQKDLASEYAGHAGKVVQSAVERHGLDRPAFSMTLKLSKMEVVKQQATIRAFIQYVQKAGMLDQMDAFSDLVTELEALVETLKSRIPNEVRSDPAIDKLRRH